MLSPHTGTVKVIKHSQHISVEKGIQSQKSTCTAVLASLQKRSITVSLLGLISQILVKTVNVWPFNCIFWYIMQFESFLERTRL